jgi:hypothetical protein
MQARVTLAEEPEENAMDPKFWNKPLCYESALTGEWRVVDSAAEAILILQNRWPLSRGRRLAKARKICLKVLEGKRSAEKGRKSFIRAAKEAHVHVEG